MVNDKFTFKDRAIASNITRGFFDDGWKTSLAEFSRVRGSQDLPRISLGGSTKPSGALFMSSGRGVFPFDDSMAGC